MIDRKIALRYARALYGLCIDKKLQLEDIVKDFRKIAATLNANQELFNILKITAIQPSKKLNIINDLFQNEVNENLLNFISYVISKGRSGIIEGICEIFEELVNKSKNRIHAVAASAVKLDEYERQLLKKAFEHKLNKTMDFSFMVDNSLIAGIVVQIGDIVYDGSLKSYIENIKHRLLKLAV